MVKVYLVIGEIVGEEGESTFENITASLSKETAEDAADKLNQLRQFNQEFHKKEQEECVSPWLSANKAPEHPKRKRLQPNEEYQLALKEFQVKQIEYNNALEKHLVEWRKDNYFIPAEFSSVYLLLHYSADNYSVSSLELL